jgi:hypothetical protein
MVDTFCDERTRCIDVTPALLRVAPDDLDRGHDGTHFGPKVNRVIAGTVAEALQGVRPTRPASSR